MVLGCNGQQPSQLFKCLGFFLIISDVDFRVSGDCATNHDVGRNDVIRLLVLEAENSSSCTVNVSATADGACQKLCYIFSQNSFIKNTNVTFTVENSTSSQVLL